MISLDTKEVKDLADDLRKLNERGLAFATREAINQTAWKARQFAHRNIDQKMVQRNRWTKGSVRVEKARSLRISAQEAAVGSTESYMETQEFGGTERAQGKHGVPIPTSYSAGQMGAKPRTRLPRRANRLPNIQLARSRSFKMLGKNRRQRVIVAIQMAVQSGKKYVYLESSRRRKKGIYKILGGDRTEKRGWPDGMRIRMVYDLTLRTIRVNQNKWLTPAALVATLRTEDHFRRALMFQLKRLHTAKRR
jgi:hypothetical protein